MYSQRIKLHFSQFLRSKRKILVTSLVFENQFLKTLKSFSSFFEVIKPKSVKKKKIYTKRKKTGKIREKRSRRQKKDRKSKKKLKKAR